jgi:hypothetical protein
MDHTMSPAAFAMRMVAANEQFRAAFSSEDLEAVESALEDMNRLHRAYYGYDAFCVSAVPVTRAAPRPVRVDVGGRAKKPPTAVNAPPSAHQAEPGGPILTFASHFRGRFCEC